jgi:hypothetical protein
LGCKSSGFEGKDKKKLPVAGFQFPVLGMPQQFRIKVWKLETGNWKLSPPSCQQLLNGILFDICGLVNQPPKSS